jgi:hypothetical protein
MLQTEELNSLLKKGRVLQEEISAFIKAPNTYSSQQLIVKIDELIKAIKPQLLAPSINESPELGLLIANLGRIVKNLNHMKTIINSH